MKYLYLSLTVLLSLPALPALAQQPLVLPANMKVLRCQAPNTTYHFISSSAPGQLFFPDEPVNVTLAFTRGTEKSTDKGTVLDFAIEIQEITTRTPGRVIEGMEGFSDTAGHAPLIELEGKPVRYPLKVTFDEKPETQVEVADLPVQRKLGTYALVLERGKDRQFLATVARLPHPRPGGNLENTPIFGEGQFLSRPELYNLRCQVYARMGIHGFRYELSWSEAPDGTYDWNRYDPIFDAASANHIQIMATLGGHPWHFLPFGEPAPAAGYVDTPYSGHGDWLCDPTLYPRYGKWITAFCSRYWKEGRGSLWGIDNYNEPWEGGGISGWARDCLQYRALQKLIANSARQVSPQIKMLAASSIMNTEDKFYSAGDREFDRYIDIFTDHYVVPPMCYGPLVARAHGKTSAETETWMVNSEFLLPQAMAQFMAAGQQRLAPWHPRVLFDTLPGAKDEYLIPTPVVAATAAFNYFTTGMPFEKIVFRDHLPWVFQYGKDTDKDALLVLFGQLMSIGSADPRQRVWAQVEGSSGGTMTIDNHDGLLQFYDLAGNPLYQRQKTVTLPMSIFPTYITSARGPVAAAQRIGSARILGKRPVEILPHDFTMPLTAHGAALLVDLHNCLNRALSGRLAVTAPRGITLKLADIPISLAPGETKSLRFETASATPLPANAYPFQFHFASDAGNTEYQEVMNVTAATRKTIAVDGSLEDWQDIPGITLVGGGEKANLTESLRRPWLELKDKQPNGSFAEIKMAWDDDFLYLAAQVNSPKPQMDHPRQEGLDPNQFFHTAADDALPHYKEFLQKHPGHSFAEVPYVYARNPEPPLAFRGDRFQFGLDVTPDWHDLQPDTNRIPYGFHAVPDTDYEYSAYLCADGKGELWRLLAPGVPRMHDFPREPRGVRSTGPVPGARYVVRQEGNTRIYEIALPRTELADLQLKPGTRFGFTFRIGSADGPNMNYGVDKAVTKVNGLTLHPYWEPKPSCGVRWSLVE